MQKMGSPDPAANYFAEAAKKSPGINVLLVIW
jgi:hypothetical protein